jgi:hypothetical protein
MNAIVDAGVGWSGRILQKLWLLKKGGGQGDPDFTVAILRCRIYEQGRL